MRYFLRNDGFDYDRRMPRAGAPVAGTTGSRCSSMARGSSTSASCSSGRRASSGRAGRGQRHAEARGGSSSSKASGKVQEAEGLTRRVRDALGLLVQEPLRQLLACLNSEEELMATAGLCPLTAFLQRVLTSLQELHHILVGLNEEGHVVLLSWLTDTREELVRWGECAGMALRGLAASADARGVGQQLHRLQDRLAETLGDIKAGQQQEQELAEVALRSEVAQLRDDLRGAEQRAAAAAEQSTQERRQWCQMLEGFMQVASGRSGDDQAPEKRRWRGLIEDVARSHSEGQVADHASSVWRLSELWASFAAQRDKEMQSLQQRADNARAELRQGELQSESEQRQLQLARDSVTRELQDERRAHATALAQLQERADSDLGREKRERAALSLQLSEALDSVATRDRSIEELKRSLGEAEERSRCPPVPSAPPPLAAVTSAGTGMAPAHSLVPPLPPACDATSGRDGAASVCRISTESTPGGSGCAWLAGGSSQAASAVPPVSSANAAPGSGAWNAAVLGLPPSLAGAGGGSSASSVLEASVLKQGSSPSRPWKRSVAEVSTHSGEASLLGLLNSTMSTRADSSPGPGFGSSAGSGAAAPAVMAPCLGHRGRLPEAAGSGAAAAAGSFTQGGAAHGSQHGLEGGVDANVRPWDLPAKDFLELWRQTRGVHTASKIASPSRPLSAGAACSAGGRVGVVGLSRVSSAAGELESLRITTNFE